jgi:hypothetical protein|uniref:Uncharacterized protein n=1 Tax=viral metagenome TaxID=1070528 RepID=A0A6C0JMI7_9ZZZZ
MFIFLIIISNICLCIVFYKHQVEYKTPQIIFIDFFIIWNIITISILIWVWIYEPTPETLNWMISFIK